MIVQELTLGEYYGRPFLYHAIEGNRVEVARALLENGVDVNEILYEAEGISYLHMVRSEKMAKLLLEHGADVHRRSIIHNQGVFSAVWMSLFDLKIFPEKGRTPYAEAKAIRKVFKKAGAGFANRIKRQCARALLSLSN